MPVTKAHFQPVYDQDKNLLGIYLSPELWLKAQDELSPAIDKALEELDPTTVKLPPEPIKDWELLAQYWDFKYAMPTDVSCTLCGASTPDWQKDEPRKFRLRSATLGGLVNFECQGCKARIVKKHFPKHVDVACHPHSEK